MFVTAVVTAPMRYIAVDREVLRQLLYEDGSLSDLLLTAFVERRELLQQRQGIGFEIVGPRESPDTRRLLDFSRDQRLPHTWTNTDEHGAAAAIVDGLTAEEIPLVRLPGGAELRNPSNGELLRALGIGLELSPREEVDLLIVGGGPAGLGAAVYGASEGLDTLVIESTALGGQAGSSRRIENYLGFPAGISGTELTSRAITQARKFGARVASPYRAKRSSPAASATWSGSRTASRSPRAPSCSPRARNTGVCPSTISTATRASASSTRPAPLEGQLCAGQRVAVVGGGNSAGQAAVWLSRGGALVTVLHRRADLRETMSQYLIDELDRFGVAVRDRSEISQLDGADGRLEAVTLTDGMELRFSYVFCFLGADPCTTGSTMCSRETRTGSSSPAPRRESTACWRRACPASTRPATCGPAR